MLPFFLSPLIISDLITSVVKYRSIDIFSSRPFVFLHINSLNIIKIHSFYPSTLFITKDFYLVIMISLSHLKLYLPIIFLVFPLLFILIKRIPFFSLAKLLKDWVVFGYCWITPFQLFSLLPWEDMLSALIMNYKTSWFVRCETHSFSFNPRIYFYSFNLSSFSFLTPRFSIHVL